MSELIIKNDVLEVCILTKGAQIKSVKGDKEYMWEGNPDIWGKHAPVLFPICGNLKDGKYTYKGNTYNMKSHGFSGSADFAVREHTADSLTLFIEDNEETKKCYPFDYVLRVTYRLEGKKLQVRYEVENKSADTMYFSIGSHEGYYCPEGIEEYDVILPEPETLESSVLEGPILGNNKIQVLENSDTLALKYDYFTEDALVFTNIKARSATLRHRNSRKAVRVYFPDREYFLLWTKPGAPYICMEPWCGISDRVGSDQNFKTKEGIRSVAPGQQFVSAHTVEILTPIE